MLTPYEISKTFLSFRSPMRVNVTFRKHEFLSEQYSVDLRSLQELVVCHAAEADRCVSGEKARRPADGDSAWLPLTHLAVFSGRYFIRNVPWVVQTRQTPTWCLSSSHAPQAGGFFYYTQLRVTPLLETG